jgi:hypothetical protein
MPSMVIDGKSVLRYAPQELYILRRLGAWKMKKVIQLLERRLENGSDC